MTTNAQLLSELCSRLQIAALGYPIAWPGVDFQPPESGIWLEVSFFPTQGIDQGLAPGDTVVPQGIFQIAVMARSGVGYVPVLAASDSVMAVYPKNTTIIAPVRVQRAPYVFDLPVSGDRIGAIVTVPYSG